jgi:hypothetical protein
MPLARTLTRPSAACFVRSRRRPMRMCVHYGRGRLAVSRAAQSASARRCRNRCTRAPLHTRLHATANVARWLNPTHFSLRLFLSAAVVLRQERALYVPAAQLRQRCRRRLRGRVQCICAAQMRAVQLLWGLTAVSAEMRGASALLRSWGTIDSGLACGCIVCQTSLPLPRRLPIELPCNALSDPGPARSHPCALRPSLSRSPRATPRRRRGTAQT